MGFVYLAQWLQPHEIGALPHRLSLNSELMHVLNDWKEGANYPAESQGLKYTGSDKILPLPILPA